jgi:NAD(P)-dependent dehydrogenase (short-subunit alcohol dehydrogenase family)
MNDNTPPEIRSDSPVYLVLGANGGVGYDLTMRLCKRGLRVILVGRNTYELSRIADGADAPFIICDATDFNQMKDCFETVREKFGRIQGVANCVGSILLKPAHLTTEEEWCSVITANLTSAFLTVKYASKAMMGNGGSIVLVSSCAARVGLPNHEAIAAAKAGVEGLVRSAAATYARHQIRVNCVAPGLLRTNMSRSITSNVSQLQASEESHPLGRIGTAADVAVVMEWLLGEESSWVTGQSVAVDGGLSSVRSIKPHRQATSSAPGQGISDKVSRGTSVTIDGT